MSFANDFHAVAAPRLGPPIKAQGFLLAADCVDFSDARRAVNDVAIQFGASYLPAPVLDDLLDWIAAALLREFAQAEPRVATIEAEIDAQREADPVAYYRDLAATCADPERMRWVFAAICPEYRAYLIATRKPQGRDFTTWYGAQLARADLTEYARLYCLKRLAGIHAG